VLQDANVAVGPFADVFEDNPPRVDLLADHALRSLWQILKKSVILTGVLREGIYREMQEVRLEDIRGTE
jgi:hypothetical protein